MNSSSSTPGFAERDEEAARARIDDRLKGDFRFVHRQPIRFTLFLPAAPRKSPIAMSVEDLDPVTAEPRTGSAARAACTFSAG